MENILNINTIFFTVFGYPMSYMEFFGTILNIWSVYLVSKNKILNWPVGIVASILFMFLFWQIQLYSDFMEQVYFVITGVWGWIAWSLSNRKQIEEKNYDQISYLNISETYSYVIIIIVGTVLLGYFTSVAHILLPKLFAIPASFAYLDAFTTVLSFVATYMLIIKKIEAWFMWIIVDIIGIGLYFVKDVKFISILYVIFLVLAIRGLLNWRRLHLESNNKYL